MDWSRYLKCPGCAAEAARPCLRLTGMRRNRDTDQLEEVTATADKPHGTRKQTTRTTGPAQPRAPRLPAEPADPLAPKAAAKSRAALARRSTAQQRMVNAWTDLANRRNTT